MSLYVSDYTILPKNQRLYYNREIILLEPNMNVDNGSMYDPEVIPDFDRFAVELKNVLRTLPYEDQMRLIKRLAETKKAVMNSIAVRKRRSSKLGKAEQQEITLETKLLDFIYLSQRTVNALLKHGIFSSNGGENITIGDLVDYVKSGFDLKTIHQLGDDSLAEVYEFLDAYGLYTKDTDPTPGSNLTDFRDELGEEILGTLLEYQIFKVRDLMRMFPTIDEWPKLEYRHALIQPSKEKIAKFLERVTEA